MIKTIQRAPLGKNVQKMIVKVSFLSIFVW